MKHSEIEPATVHKAGRDEVLIALNEPPLPLILGPEQRRRLEQEFPELCSRYRVGNDGGARWQASALELETAKLGAAPSELTSWEAVRGVPHQQVLALLLEEASSAHERERARGEFIRFCRAATPRTSTSLCFVNRADHPFFYRKVHEHVPGTMLIEAQRQAVYQHFYATTAHKHGAVTLSLNRLDARFMDYTNLMYPVEILVDDLTGDGFGRPRRIFYRVSFFQKGKLVGLMDTHGTAIDLPRFDSLRSLFMHEGEWFRPLGPGSVRAVVQRDGAAPVEAEVLALSKSGLRLGGAGHAAQSGVTAVIELSDANGYAVSLRSRVREVSEAGSEWSTLDLNHEQLVLISKMVTRACVLAPSSSEPGVGHGE